MTQSYCKVTVLMAVVIATRSAVAQPAPQSISAKLQRAITEYTQAIQLATSPQKQQEIDHALKALRRVAIPTSIDASRRLGCNESGGFVFPPSWEITNDTIITCPKVTFPDSAKVRIRNAAALLIDAEQIVVGKSVEVDGTGEPGPRGGPGLSINKEWISGSDAAYWAALNDCRSRSNHPDRGGKGISGDKGGSGGHLIISVPTQQPLQPKLSGGKGGSGGPGGSGRLLKNSRNYYCDGCTMNCPSNGDGDPGPDGISGRFILLA